MDARLLAQALLGSIRPGFEVLGGPRVWQAQASRAICRPGLMAGLPSSAEWGTRLDASADVCFAPPLEPPRNREGTVPVEAEPVIERNTVITQLRSAWIEAYESLNEVQLIGETARAENRRLGGSAAADLTLERVEKSEEKIRKVIHRLVRLSSNLQASGDGRVGTS